MLQGRRHGRAAPAPSVAARLARISDSRCTLGDDPRRTLSTRSRPLARGLGVGASRAPKERPDTNPFRGNAPGVFHCRRSQVQPGQPRGREVMFGASARPRSRVLVLLSALAAIGVLAAPAVAKPPAPGAPGTIHTWAPADKHGFGTAHQLREQRVWFTLRQALAERDLLPRPRARRRSAASQFAVTRRQDVRRPRDRRRRPAPHRAARRRRDRARGAARRARSASGRSRRRHALAADQDVDHRSARARPCSRSVRFESLTGKPLKLYVLADPAPGDDGNDDRGHERRRPARRLRRRRAPASSAATPRAARRRRAATAARASDPWKRPRRTTSSLSDYDATQPGNVVQGARTALNGRAATRR